MQGIIISLHKKIQENINKMSSRNIVIELHCNWILVKTHHDFWWQLVFQTIEVALNPYWWRKGLITTSGRIHHVCLRQYYGSVNPVIWLRILACRSDCLELFGWTNIVVSDDLLKWRIWILTEFVHWKDSGQIKWSSWHVWTQIMAIVMHAHVPLK